MQFVYVYVSVNDTMCECVCVCVFVDLISSRTLLWLLLLNKLIQLTYHQKVMTCNKNEPVELDSIPANMYPYKFRKHPYKLKI